MNGLRSAACISPGKRKFEKQHCIIKDDGLNGDQNSESGLKCFLCISESFLCKELIFAPAFVWLSITAPSSIHVSIGSVKSKWLHNENYEILIFFKFWALWKDPVLCNCSCLKYMSFRLMYLLFRMDCAGLEIRQTKVSILPSHLLESST